MVNSTSTIYMIIPVIVPVLFAFHLYPWIVLVLLASESCTDGDKSRENSTQYYSDILPVNSTSTIRISRVAADNKSRENSTSAIQK